MFVLLRLLGLLLACLTVVYVCVWAWLRSGERARLEEEWARERPPLPRHTHVAIGLASQSDRLRWPMILGVFVIPATAFLLLLAWLNYG